MRIRRIELFEDDVEGNGLVSLKSLEDLKRKTMETCAAGFGAIIFLPLRQTECE